MYGSNTSEQLELDLGMPWLGRSPRELTRAAILFRFGPEGTSRANLDVPRLKRKGPQDLLQLELFDGA